MEGSRPLIPLPVLVLKNDVLFPYLMMPVAVGRAASLAAVEAALESEGKELFVITQRNSEREAPEQEDLYPIGTRAVIKKMARRENALMDLIVHGVDRAALVKFDRSGEYPQAMVNPLPFPKGRGPEIEALKREIIALLTKAISLAKPDSEIDPTHLVATSEEPLRLAYMMSTMLNLDSRKEQQLLEAESVLEALRLVHSYLTHEVQVLELREKIANAARTEMGKEQREYMLRQQLRAIKEELGDSSANVSESDNLREQLEEVDLPEVVQKEAERELNRLQRLSPGAPDSNVIRTYLELILELPWTKSSEDILDMPRARRVLDEDHYDLTKIKTRILEHLAVLKLNPHAKAPILCFAGPPGVGKTSLGQSIARALKRKFERMSLGGLHDEAELRGHRRTYIGAMPGRILQAIRRAGVNNPVLMLDEVDKLGRDFRGDPAFALLEILDPEQNKHFRDNYLDLPFDLSKVFFITTANSLDTIPGPLLDRLEVLQLSGYSDEEKLEIALRYLLDRRLQEAGLGEERCQITDDALRLMISRYTREAGVRQLERTIGQVARKVALRIAEGEDEKVVVDAPGLPELLGPEHFLLAEARQQLPPGVAAGLAWTPTGGEVLYVEAVILPASKGLTLTGQLGEVMQESAKTAWGYVLSRADGLGAEAKKFARMGVHVHVPAGAIPKDGPSAGITMTAALASLCANRSLRSDTAMTGEVTLTGLVLPIGGLKEKVLAARRAGLSRVILPKQNKKDLKDLPADVTEQMSFVLVESAEEVLEAAFD